MHMHPPWRLVHWQAGSAWPGSALKLAMVAVAMIRFGVGKNRGSAVFDAAKWYHIAKSFQLFHNEPKTSLKY
jgi:hypothetical protein